MLQTAALFFFPAVMAFAASSDLLTMRISNRLVLALAAGFLVLAAAVGMPLNVFLLHLAAAALVLVVCFTFFAFGWMGGGDAKLAAATALWLGFTTALPQYLAYAALLGGLLTLMLLALRRLPLTPLLARYRWLERLHHPKTGIPYGIALAAAGLMVYSNTVIFQALSGTA